MQTTTNHVAEYIVYSRTLDGDTMECVTEDEQFYGVESSDLEWSTDGSTATGNERDALINLLVTWLKNDGITEYSGRRGMFHDPDGSFISDYATGERLENVAVINADADVLDAVAAKL